MTYPADHKVPAAPEGKIWTRITKGKIEDGDWLAYLHAYADGAIGSLVNDGFTNWTVYRLRDILAPARKVSPKPANHIVPKGYVYLGKRGEFKVPATTFAGYHVFADDVLNEGNRASRWKGKGSGYYYAPVDSEVARLNGLDPKAKKPKSPTLRDENTRLTKEVADLKAELARLRSRECEVRDFATKIVNKLS